ncbi:MAG: cohesin domain-containing protein [Candidatus Taylorbacteria bacterium]
MININEIVDIWHRENHLQRFVLVAVFSVSYILFNLPSTTSAQTVTMKTAQSKYNVGDSFIVSLNLDAKGKQINSMGGSILIPTQAFEVSNIEIGGSFISLWIDRPSLENIHRSSTSSEIRFSGGLPGGYSGSSGNILSFVLTALKHGDQSLSVDNFNAYINDGRGTALSNVTITKLRLSVGNDDRATKIVYKPSDDTTSPEPFDISLGSDPTVTDNDYFVSFFAVDKGSGVTRYEIEERPWIISILGVSKLWTQAQSPQILYYQKWISTIEVRAFDASGNVREESIIKPFNIGVSAYLLLIIVVILFIIIFPRVIRWYNQTSIKSIQ